MAAGIAVRSPVHPAVRNAARQDGDLSALEARLGHSFADRDTLLRALTHRSALGPREPVGRSYQILEFLGDRVLALVIADALIAAFPDADEGELAQRFNRLVQAATCAEIAEELDLGPHLRLGEGEAQSGGRRKAAILGDVCEALIGALYQDGGLEVARAFIDAHWRRRMLDHKGPLRDAKTTLQEWAQGRGLPSPTYRLRERTGPDHAPNFVIVVEIADHETALGSGGSKRTAEQAAAAAFLRRHGVWKDDERN